MASLVLTAKSVQFGYLNSSGNAVGFAAYRVSPLGTSMAVTTPTAELLGKSSMDVACSWIPGSSAGRITLALKGVTVSQAETDRLVILPFVMGSGTGGSGINSLQILNFIDLPLNTNAKNATMDGPNQVLQISDIFLYQTSMRALDTLELNYQQGKATLTDFGTLVNQFPAPINPATDACTSRSFLQQKNNGWHLALVVVLIVCLALLFWLLAALVLLGNFAGTASAMYLEQKGVKFL